MFPRRMLPRRAFPHLWLIADHQPQRIPLRFRIGRAINWVIRHRDKIIYALLLFFGSALSGGLMTYIAFLSER